MKYKIYPTLYSEIRKGTVWTYYKTDSNLIKIKNIENKKSVIISHREIDSNFINVYNKSDFTNKLVKNSCSEIIIFDEYYRNKLGISNYNEVELKIKPVKSYQFWYKLSFLKNHSDEVVKITFWFTLVTFLFCLYSYIISLENLFKILKAFKKYIFGVFSLIF